MHQSHALFGYKRPGFIPFVTPSVPAADIVAAFLPVISFPVLGVFSPSIGTLLPV
jgi:hypothetical protein